MDQFVIQGGSKLQGEVKVLGAKNAILPMMVGAVLAKEGETVIHNVPNLRDVTMLSKILIELGATVEYSHIERTIVINCKNINNYCVPYDLVKQMRASFLLIGPLLARFGYGEISLPGGCAIGTRKINMHLEALRCLGAKIQQEDGYIKAKTDGLKGANYYFDFPSHTGTENIMMTACLAKGVTRLFNIACEPEIVDLANFLNAMGAKIKGAGTPFLIIEGVSNLSATEYTVMPSRIETGFFIASAAITRGEILIKNAVISNLGIVSDKMRQMGIKIIPLGNNQLLVKRATNRLHSVSFTTWPYPGFSTDFQAQMMALLTLSNGTSIVKETVFENRFMHVNELNRLGADIKVHLDEAVVCGVSMLKGACLMATDLQAGAGLVLASLAAKGESTIDRVYHIDRGYEQMEIRLAKLGASIKRFNPIK